MPSSKRKHVRTPESTNRHTRSAFKPPRPPPRNSPDPVFLRLQFVCCLSAVRPQFCTCAENSCALRGLVCRANFPVLPLNGACDSHRQALACRIIDVLRRCTHRLNEKYTLSDIFSMLSQHDKSLGKEQVLQPPHPPSAVWGGNLKTSSLSLFTLGDGHGAHVHSQNALRRAHKVVHELCQQFLPSRSQKKRFPPHFV